MKVKELIELLNEYEIKREKTKMNITDKRNEWDFDNEYTPLIIISKQFWFIERLVENDKIEASEIMLDDRMWTIYDKTDSTLMMLAIKDNPLEYLCSILK